MKYRFDKANGQQQFEGLPPPAPGSIEALDTLSTPIPGQSLTDEPGSQKFERPWKYTDPDDCVEFIISRLESDQELKDANLKQLASGVPIEYIVNTIAFVGFSEGLWSPDTAELIKPPLAMYFILLGLDKDVPMVLFNPDKGDQARTLSDGDMINSMAKLNPRAFNLLTERAQSQQKAEEQRPSGGFLEEAPEELMIEEDTQPPQEGMI
tara:strand:- start:277 stop:903 length:627 start_codon:yes stop_codon:yes gene_type:complete